MCNIWNCEKIYVTHNTSAHHFIKVLSTPQMVVTKHLNYQGLEHTAHYLPRTPPPPMGLCGITNRDLKDKDTFPEVFRKMMKWIKNLTRISNRKRKLKKKEEQYFPGMLILVRHRFRPEKNTDYCYRRQLTNIDMGYLCLMPRRLYAPIYSQRDLDI